MNNNLANIKKSISFLNKNDCVAIPTETVYGLAANAYSSKAVRKIYTLKRRPINNPSIIHYSSLNQLEKDCELNKNFFKLYKKFCPGPITFVLNLKKNSKISKIATNNKTTLAVRFPRHPITRNLLKKLNFPLAAPSANLSSKVSAVSSADVKEDFGKKIKYILEGGRSLIGLESTIIDLRKKPKNQLNHYTGSEWAKASLSVHKFEGPIPSKRKEHGAAFPFRLAKHFISTYTKENDLVFDPFVGVGTTLESAKLLGRKSIGIDINKKFIKHAKAGPDKLDVKQLVEEKKPKKNNIILIIFLF